MNLQEVFVRPVKQFEEKQYLEWMQEHHYLGSLRKISETIWYIGVFEDQWVALISFSAAALKCRERDRWIGWDFRCQYNRLKLIANNSRFLILPGWQYPNLGSRILSLCHKRISDDWQEKFGHPLLLLETFVDPRYFRGTVYKAANWLHIGKTKGFRRTGLGYSAIAQGSKMIFVKPLRSNAIKLLSCCVIKPPYTIGGKKMMLKADQMMSLPQFFSEISDPRRPQGIRHPLATVLAIAAGAVLCGMCGYKAIYDWAKQLGQKARQRFQCRFEKGKYIIPSEYVIRDILIRVDPSHLDHALQRWNKIYSQQDERLAIDGKTMCNAINDQGDQTHIMSVVGHQTKICYTQKK